MHTIVSPLDLHGMHAPREFIRNELCPESQHLPKGAMIAELKSPQFDETWHCEVEDAIGENWQAGLLYKNATLHM